MIQWRHPVRLVVTYRFSAVSLDSVLLGWFRPHSPAVFGPKHTRNFLFWRGREHLRRTHSASGKLPVVQAGKGVKYEPIIDTDRSSLCPCILQLVIICGRLILSFAPTTAVEHPKDRVLLLKKTFKAANIRWRELHKESAPDGQEVQRLFQVWVTVERFLSIDGSAADTYDFSSVFSYNC